MNAFLIILLNILLSTTYSFSISNRIIPVKNNFVLKSTRSNDNSKDKLIEFLNDAKSIKSVRHVVQGQGAILEAIGSFDNLRFTDIPNKGKLATLSNDNPLFECHIRLYEIKSVVLVEVVKFEKKLFIIRFLMENGSTALSSILINTDSDSSILSKWEDLKLKYGSEIKV